MLVIVCIFLAIDRLEDAFLDERVQNGLESLADGLAIQLVGGGEAAVFRGPGAGHGKGIGAAHACDEVRRYELLVGAQLAHLPWSNRPNVGSDRKTVGSREIAHLHPSRITHPRVITHLNPSITIT